MSIFSKGRNESVDAQRGVHRFVAPNPGPKTLQGTNCYVVGRRQVYIIDPGPQDERHLADIAAWLVASGKSALAILLTHGHPDHAQGAAALANSLSVPIWAANTETYPLYAAPEHLPLRPDAVMKLNGDTLRVIPTPGHTPDSVSYFLEDAGMVFTGDTVLGHGSTIVAPPEGDMAAYMVSLDVLYHLPAKTLAPGHGPIVDAALAKLREYIEHRRMRESQLVQALAAGPSTVPALVTRLYIDTPSELRRLAEGSVLAGLKKLEREHVVRRDDDSWLLRGMEPQ